MAAGNFLVLIKKIILKIILKKMFEIMIALLY